MISLYFQICVSAAVFLNYLYSAGGLDIAAGKDAASKKYGDSLLVSCEGGEVEVTDAAAYFSETRMTRQQSREDAVETPQSLYNSAEINDEQLLHLQRRRRL